MVDFTINGSIKPSFELSYSSMIDVASAGVIGFTVGLSYGGLYSGLAAGVAFTGLSIVDSILISSKIIDKHYLASTFLWSSYSLYYMNFMPNIFIPKSLFALTLGSLIASKTEDVFDYSHRLIDNYNSYKLLEKVLGDEWQDFTRSFNLAVGIRSAQIFISMFLTIYMGSLLNRNFLVGHILNNIVREGTVVGAEMSLIFKLLNSDFLKYISYSGAILFKEFILQQISDRLVEKQSQDMTDIILEKVNELISNKEIARKLKSRGFEGQELEGELIYNLFLAKKSAMSITNSMENFLDLQAAIFLCGKRLPSVILPSIFLGIALNPIIEKYVASFKAVTMENRLVYSKAQEIINNIKLNAESISIRGGEKFLKDKLSKHLADFGVSDRERKEIEQSKDGLHKLLDLVNFILPIMSFSFANPLQADANGFGAEEQVKVISSVAFATSYLSKWSNLALGNSIANSTNVEYSIANIKLNKFISIIDSNITSALLRTVSDSDEIIFKDYTVRIHNKEILSIKDLKLSTGKHYAVVGANGIGKSTVMSDIKTGLVGDVLSYGELSLPKDTKVFMLDQSSYLPTGVSLKDKIRFPIVFEDLSEKDQKWLIDFHNELLQEFEVFENKLDAKMLEKDNVELSGGMRKKIGIIQIISEAMLEMRNSSVDSSKFVIILDESFAEIEPSSRAKIKSTLNRLLPYSTFIVVDHDANNNNSDGFYNSFLHFLSYKLKVINSDQEKIENNEIAIKCKENDIFLRVNFKDYDFRLSEEEISESLYNKFNATCANGNKEGFFSRNDLRLLKDVLLEKNYLNYDTWVVERPVYKAKTEYLDNLSVFNEPNKVCDQLNHNIDALPDEDRKIHDMICTSYCDCLVGEVL